MCMYDLHDQCDFVAASQHRSRVAHSCTECRRTILPRETYTRTFVVSDGHAWSVKVCSHCDAGIQWLLALCGGYVFGGVLEDLRDHYHELGASRVSGLGRYIAGMLRQWSRRDGTLMPVTEAIA